MIRVVVDAMGGDYAPREIVQGAVEGAREHNIEVVLVADLPDQKRQNRLIPKLNSAVSAKPSAY